MILKEKDLTPEQRALAGNTFDPNRSAGVFYIRGIYNASGFVKLPFYIMLVLALLTGAVFLLVTIVAILNPDTNMGIQTEGMIITFLIFALMGGMFLWARAYYKKTKRISAAVSAGEIRFGLWITPTHLLLQDMNNSLRGVAKKDIRRIEVSNSNGMQQLWVRLQNNRVLFITTDWLEGYYHKNEQLKQVIEERLR